MKRHYLLLATAVTAACAEAPAEVDETVGRVMTIVIGDGQEGPSGRPVALEPTVRVTNRNGMPEAGVEVLWRVSEGGGAVDAFRTFTDSAGHSAVRWTLGDDIGPQLLYASTAGTAGVTFRARSDLFFSSVSTGWRHSCGLDPRGLAWCWGNNFWGQLGDGTRTNSVESRPVAGRHAFNRLYPGMLHTCALTAQGDAYCWGDNGSGQLGDGTSRHSMVPVLVLGGQRFRALAVGYTHTCGITVQGSLHCWGSDAHGQTTARPESCPAGPCSRLPARIDLDGVILSVAAGEAHSCAANGREQVFCWGLNDWGQLGIGYFGGSMIPPTEVSGGVRLQQLMAWGRTTCGLNERGAAFCWGMNNAGKLGIGSLLNLDRPAPVATQGVLFAELGIGDEHACGRTESGQVYCWGALVGNGSSAVSLLPVRTDSVRTYSSLSAAGGQTCGYAGDVWCWGSNSHAQLGVDTVTVRRAEAPLLVRRGPPQPARP
jgi:alpha-tubulin suppressor-like RCC1 family protein